MLVLPRRTLFFGYTIRKNKDDLANTTYKYKTQYRGVNCIQLNTGGDGHTGNDTGGGEQTQKGRDRHSIRIYIILFLDWIYKNKGRWGQTSCAHKMRWNTNSCCSSIKNKDDLAKKTYKYNIHYKGNAIGVLSLDSQVADMRGLYH